MMLQRSLMTSVHSSASEPSRGSGSRILGPPHVYCSVLFSLETRKLFFNHPAAVAVRRTPPTTKKEAGDWEAAEPLRKRRLRRLTNINKILTSVQAGSPAIPDGESCGSRIALSEMRGFAKRVSEFSLRIAPKNLHPGADRPNVPVCHFGRCRDVLISTSSFADCGPGPEVVADRARGQKETDSKFGP